MLLNDINIRGLCWPVTEMNIVSFKPFSGSSGCMLGIIILLENDIFFSALKSSCWTAKRLATGLLVWLPGFLNYQIFSYNWLQPLFLKTGCIDQTLRISAITMVALAEICLYLNSCNNIMLFFHLKTDQTLRISANAIVV
jgi:hypothetical protein